MKLRLRSLECKETLKIEALNTSSLHQLKEIISQTLHESPSPNSIRLSLNRKDELQSDTEESLQALGIAGGDLIFYSLDQAASFTNPSFQRLKPIDAPKSVYPNSEASISLNHVSNPNNLNSVDLTSQKRKTLDLGAQVEEKLDNMEVDEGCIDGNDVGGDFMDVEERFSVPGFLRKLLVEELGGDSGSNHKLIVLAIHAVLLESGFVGFDPIENTVVKGFNFRETWPSPFKLSLFYTLPEIVTGAQGNSIDNIVLKFQPLGKFMNVYGSLGDSGSGKVTLVQLNEDQLVPFLNVVWANCGANENVSVLDTTAEKEVFKLWRSVKDNLALPLLIDICEKAGFDLPPCFMRLPSDLKLKILETLPGVDVAKVSGVCSELHYLASSDELWKLKFGEEFDKDVKAVQGSWRNAFARKWEIRKISRKFSEGSRRVSPFTNRFRQRYAQPVIFQHPHIVGGEYDLSGDFGNPANPLNNTRRLFGPANHLRRNFSPHCNLGGYGI